MANHSPLPDNHVLSKTWDEATTGAAASGTAELPEGTVSLTAAEYALLTPVAGTLYYETDTGNLYRGATKITTI